MKTANPEKKPYNEGVVITEPLETCKRPETFLQSLKLRNWRDATILIVGVVFGAASGWLWTLNWAVQKWILP